MKCKAREKHVGRGKLDEEMFAVSTSWVSSVAQMTLFNMTEDRVHERCIKGDVGPGWYL